MPARIVDQLLRSAGRRAFRVRGADVRQVPGCALGRPGARGPRLAGRLSCWQWADGGWNCDVRPGVRSSSVHETLLPMRGVLVRRSTGGLVSRDWAKLHYPAYWHYDILAGLTGLAELGLLADPRCRDALDLLESKRLPDGGWAAEGRWYRGSGERRPGYDHVDWSGVGSRRANEWTSAACLRVLAAAGRL